MEFIGNLFKKKYKLIKHGDRDYEAFERFWWSFEWRSIGTATDILAALDLFLPQNKRGGNS